jgi:hypothetical protein
MNLPYAMNILTKMEKTKLTSIQKKGKKRQLTEWEKIFANCLSNKSLTPEYIMNSDNSRKQNK